MGIPQVIPLSKETQEKLLLYSLFLQQTAQCVKFKKSHEFFKQNRVLLSRLVSPFRMNGQKQWTRVVVMALLMLTVMAAEGGKAEKQGESSKAQSAVEKPIESCSQSIDAPMLFSMN